MPTHCDTISNQNIRVAEARYRQASALLDAAQAAQDTVDQVQTEPRGTVRVTCPVTLAQTAQAIGAHLLQVGVLPSGVAGNRTGWRCTRQPTRRLHGPSAAIVHARRAAVWERGENLPWVAE